MRTGTGPRRDERGFTLIEMLVVVLIIGILAATAVPQYAKVTEKSKVAEALAAVQVLKGAEDRYFNRYGVYCQGSVTAGCLDVNPPNLKYFNAFPGIVAGTGNPSWKITVTRNQAIAYYGAYVLTFDVEPNAAPALTCSNASCTAELLPMIH